MKKDVGITTAQKSKETRRMEMGSIFVLYIQPTIPTYIRTLLHYNLKLPDVYVGIVGWIYRTKIDPISILLVPYFFVSLHLFFISGNDFPLFVPGLFSLLFYGFRIHSSMCMQGQMILQ